MAFTPQKFIGEGTVFMREAGASAPLADAGHSDELTTSPELTEFSVPNRRGGGGNAAVKKRLTKYGVSIKFYDFTPARLALALQGKSSAVAAGTVTAEAHVAWPGGLVPLAYIDPSTVVVKDETDTTTYTEGTDYVVLPGGIEVLASGTIPDPADNTTPNLHIDYAYGAQQIIEAFTDTGREYEMVLSGLNGEDGRPYRCTIHRFTPDPSSVKWLGEGYGVLEISGEALADTSRPAGESQFMTAVLMDPTA